MIVTRQRPLERLLDNLASVEARTVALVGCGGCASQAGTGDEAALAARAEEFEAAGYRVVARILPEAACNVGMVAVAIRKAPEVADADAVVVLSCGSGVQAVADALPATPTFPALESMFVGNTLRQGVWEERCRLCGSCGLDKTAGICIYTSCPKGLLNGPCGGMWDGRCEVLEDRECAHVQMYRRLEAQGRLTMRVKPAKNHATELHPGTHATRTPRGEGR